MQCDEPAYFMENSTEHLTPSMNPPTIEINDGALGEKCGHWFGSPTVNIPGILIAESDFTAPQLSGPFNLECVSSLWYVVKIDL